MHGVCAVDGCERQRYQRSRFCVTHKFRLFRYGDPAVSLDRRGRIAVGVDGYVHHRGTRLHRAVLLAKIGPGSHPCHWCGGQVSWDRTYPRHRDGLVVDHLDGDKANNDPENLVPAHNGCNAGRAASARHAANRAA